MTPLEYFLKVHGEIEESLPYNPAWSSLRTGFDFAVFRDDSPKLPHGGMVKSVSATSQPMIIIGTRFGNVVIYQRYSPGKGLLPSLGVNCTKYFRKGGWVRSNEPTLEDLLIVLGDDKNPNIGKRIEELKRLLSSKN